MLDVTVCILSYNRPAFLREALLSVLAQTKRPRKIAIYDNGSRDEVYKSIKDLIGESVQWVGTESNHPFIWNFSRAMNDCGTRYVMMLHDDDKLCPDFLERQISLLETTPRLGAVSCNGYFIDQAGHRTGGTLVSVADGEPVETYTFSWQVAMKYAGNSCIPLSSAVYRVDIARSLRFREEFGKVCDAVYFCELAEKGSIAYQTKPLYECRVHPGQDSSHFPFDLMNKLEEYFWSRKCADNTEINRLHALLLKQHAARNLKQIALALRRWKLHQAISLFGDSKFRSYIAVQVVWVRMFQKISRKW